MFTNVGFFYLSLRLLWRICFIHKFGTFYTYSYHFKLNISRGCRWSALIGVCPFKKEEKIGGRGGAWSTYTVLCKGHIVLPGIEGTAQLPAILSNICTQSYISTYNTTVEPGQRSSQLHTVSLSLQQTFGYQIRGLQYRGLVLSRSLHSKVPNIYFWFGLLVDFLLGSTYGSGTQV
jgi:hypothetical protein